MKEENAKETLDNKSLEEDINTLFQKDHIVIKQPKLLRIKKNDMNNVQKIIPNLNDEYKEEIEKNPESILYYIFCDIEQSNSFETTQEDVE